MGMMEITQWNTLNGMATSTTVMTATTAIYNGRDHYGRHNGYNDHNGRDGHKGYNGYNRHNYYNGLNAMATTATTSLNGSSGYNGHDGYNNYNNHDGHNGYNVHDGYNGSSAPATETMTPAMTHTTHLTFHNYRPSSSQLATTYTYIWALSSRQEGQPSQAKPSLGLRAPLVTPLPRKRSPWILLLLLGSRGSTFSSTHDPSVTCLGV